MQKTQYSAEDEQELMVQLWSPQIANNPETFVLFVFPWGQEGTPLAKFKGPRAWQRRVLRRLADHIKENNGALNPKVFRKALASGRGIGKSALVAWLVLWFVTTRIGASVIVSANTETQLRTITWSELSKWAAMALNAHWWEIVGIKMDPAKWIRELVERDLRKGTRYWGAEGKLWSADNPDAYAGPHNHDGMMVIFDEASGIDDGIWSVASGFFTEEIADRYWFAFSNPRREVGYFYECFNSKRDFWETEQIDARTVEGTDKAYYQQIVDEYGEDSIEAKVEVYGEFPTGGDDNFIGSTLVDDATARALHNDMTAPVIIGVDPARGGADSTVIVVRKGRDLTTIRRFQGDDTMTVVGHVIDAIQEFHPALVVIDEGGLGYGILDRLHEQKYKVVRGVNFGSKSKTPRMWGNKRAEMWGAMKSWLKTASIPKDRLLKADLMGPKKKPNSAGIMFLEGKKEMKARGLASPDSADAIAVTFAFPVAHRDAPVVAYKHDSKWEQSYSSQSTSWMSC
jgi:hypothetical protein